MAKTLIGDFTSERSSTVGVGPIVLSTQIAGYAKFSESVSSGSVWYAIEDGDNRESGFGTFDGVNTITRDSVLATLSNGNYDDTTPTPISLSGNSIIGCSFTAEAFREQANKLDWLSGGVEGQVLTWNAAIDTKDYEFKFPDAGKF